MKLTRELKNYLNAWKSVLTINDRFSGQHNSFSQKAASLPLNITERMIDY